jgi:hypothetical protein
VIPSFIHHRQNSLEKHTAASCQGMYSKIHSTRMSIYKTKLHSRLKRSVNEDWKLDESPHPALRFPSVLCLLGVFSAHLPTCTHHRTEASWAKHGTRLCATLKCLWQNFHRTLRIYDFFPFGRVYVSNQTLMRGDKIYSKVLKRDTTAPKSPSTGNLCLHSKLMGALCKYGS